MLGAREITSGVGILSGRRPSSNWMWSRVGGDAIDLALLGAAFRQMRPKRNKLAMTTAAVAGVTALGAAFRKRSPKRTNSDRRGGRSDGSRRDLLSATQPAQRREGRRRHSRGAARDDQPFPRETTP